MTMTESFNQLDIISDCLEKFSDRFSRQLDELNSDIGTFLIEYKNDLTPANFRILKKQIAERFKFSIVQQELSIEVAAGNIDSEIAKKTATSTILSAFKRRCLPRIGDTVSVPTINDTFVDKKAEDLTKREIDWLCNKPQMHVVMRPQIVDATDHYVENGKLILISKNRKIGIAIKINADLIKDLM